MLTPAGTFLDVYEVNFTTKSGVRSQTQIPVEEFTPEEVNRRVQIEAEKIESVMKL
jgi:hypothetical protein